MTHTITVGISGLSSTGKTTLAQHLRKLFKNLTIPLYSPGAASENDNAVPATLSFDVYIVHQDDFYLPESSLPMRKVTVVDDAVTEETVELADWDFPGALNYSDMTKALRLLREGVAFKEAQKIWAKNETIEEEDHGSDQIANTTPSEENKGVTGITENVLREIKDEITTKLAAVQWTSVESPQSVRIRLIIVDGFMLYHLDEDEAQPTSSPLIPLLDLKLLLRAPYALAKERREGREYVTSDGMWKDPKGYFDGIVWPNYIRYHRHLFVGNDVEAAELTREWGVGGKGIELQPDDGNGGIEGLLRWASGRLVDVVLGSQALTIADVK